MDQLETQILSSEKAVASFLIFSDFNKRKQTQKLKDQLQDELPIGVVHILRNHG